MNKRAILINQVTGPLFIDIANEYVKTYDEVYLITGNVEATYAELDKRIHLVKKIKYSRKKSVFRILTWLLFFIQSYFYLLSVRKKEAKVLLVSNPPLLPFLVSIFSRNKKFNFGILIYDVYPDALVNFGYLKKESKLFNVWEKLNIKSYKSAKEIITISEVMKKAISRTADILKIRVIYPWVDTSFIKPIKKEKNWFIKEHGLLNKKIVLYSGNMGLTHDLITVLKVAKELDGKNNEFQFVFIGDGVQKEKLMSFSQKHTLTNVLFLPYQDAEVLPYSFPSADFGIVSLGTGAEGLSVPSKTFYLLAAGAAIIAISEVGSEIEFLINKNNCGISVEPNKTIELSSFLTSIDDQKLEEYKINSRKLIQNFTVKNAKFFLN